MAQEKKQVEKLTTEKTTTIKSYVVGNDNLVINDYDNNVCYREYTAKKLASYSAEIEKLATLPNVEIVENYTKNGEKFEINAKSYSEFVRLSNMLVNSAVIEIHEIYKDGKTNIIARKYIYNIDLK